MKKNRLIIPAVVIMFALLGAVYLAGGSVSISPSPLPQDGAGVPPSSNPSPAITAYYFYGDGCTHCANVKPVILALAAKYQNLDLHQMEVYHNATNQELFSQFNSEFGITTTGVPTLVVGNHILVGETQIRDNIEPIIIELNRIPANGGTPTPAIIPVTDGGNCPAIITTLTLPLIISCALIDSVNPCAFAVLVFLLLSIITLESRRRVLAVGGAYIAAVFVFYLLSGIGLFTVVQQSGFSSILFRAAAVCAIILGLVNIIDVIRKNEGFILAIPASRKEMIERYIREASLPAAFALGILVGIFELPCTGGIYLAILGMMSKTLTFSQGLPYLLLYNFIFVLPLLAILLVVAFGLSPETVNSWRLENRRVLRFLIGVAMIAIGAVMLSGWM
jgi:cytochrome c biogenesis protein CcdA/thiol-disulfide isomerase/thioredoxin